MLGEVVKMVEEDGGKMVIVAEVAEVKMKVEWWRR